jgi:tetratricopeptide (TPR) repeat protein
MVRTPLRAACLVTALLLVPRATAAQAADPKQAFTAALARFSLALDGAYGDEGPAASASLAALGRIRTQWDALIRNYESGMASEVRTAAPALAVRMHLALGSEYLDRLRFRDAVRELDATLLLDPDRPEALTVRGLIRSQITGQPREALDDFRRAATLTPNDAVRTYLHARQLLTAGGAVDATAALDRFVAVETAAGPAPDGAPFVRLGLVQEVPGIEPFFPPAPYRAGFQLLAEGRFEEGIARLEAAARVDPLMAPSEATAGRIAAAAAALRDGATQDAVAHLEAAAAAAAAAPMSSEVHRLLGLARLLGDDVDGGFTDLRRAIGLDAAYERPRIDLARALFDRERFADAVTVLTDTLSAVPDSGRARYLLGLVHQKQGDYDGAMEQLKRAAALRPLLGLNSIFQTLGALRRSQQDYDGAIDAFSRRIALVPNDAGAHHELAEMYFRKGRLAEALAEHTAALMIDPKRPESLVGVAQIRMREGRFAEAGAAARRATELEASHKEARYVLATALLRQGRTDDGSRELQEYQRLQAEATALQSKRLELGGFRRDAAVSAASGDHDRAIALLRKALEAAPGDPSAEVDLGLALLRAGKADEAIPHLRAGAVASESPDVYRHLAEAYAAAGQNDESRRARARYAQARQDALRRAGAAR